MAGVRGAAADIPCTKISQSWWNAPTAGVPSIEAAQQPGGEPGAVVAGCVPARAPARAQGDFGKVFQSFLGGAGAAAAHCVRAVCDI